MNILKLRRPVRGLGIAAAVAALLTVLTAPPALAHPQLESSTPAKGASAESVTEVELVFNGEINVAEVVVKDGAGKTFQSGAAERSGSTVTQKLSGALPAGTYTVAYRVVGEDGHPVQSDDLTFTAGGPAPAPAAGGVGAEEQTGAAATSDEQPLKVDQEQAAADEESGSGATLWILIVAGLLIGVGIGVGIVFQAKRKHRAATGSE